MQALYDKYKSRGFVVLGFPSGQFGGQEYKADADIKKFVTSKFGVTFPMFAKSDVKNGPTCNPVFVFLKAYQPEGGEISWNFTGKFLVDRSGKPVKRYGRDKPMSFESDIVDLLG